MAKANPALIDALRRTAARLAREAAGDVDYRWTHMGACNCGHLAQTVTRLSKAEIHAFALEKAGDWSEQVVDHCPASGLPMDHIIDEMLALGLTLSDLRDLERLDDRTVVGASGIPPQEIDYRNRGHVVRYLRAWARLLETEWAAQRSTNAPGETEKAPV